LPAHIEALEAEVGALQQRLADPALYRDGGAEVAAVQSRLSAAEAELAAAYARWAVLEG
jgi:ATP-binding cassette subfamily F protein uup